MRDDLPERLDDLFEEGRRAGLQEALEAARVAARPDPERFSFYTQPELRNQPEPGAMKVVGALETLVAKATTD